MWLQVRECGLGESGLKFICVTASALSVMIFMLDSIKSFLLSSENLSSRGMDLLLTSFQQEMQDLKHIVSHVQKSCVDCLLQFCSPPLSFRYSWIFSELRLCTLSRLCILYRTQKTGDLITQIKRIILQRGWEQRGEKEAEKMFSLLMLMLYVRLINNSQHNGSVW